LGSTLGSVSSLLLSAGVLAYFFISKKDKPLISLIILGITYFTISGINYIGPTEDFIKDALRYFIFIIGGISIAKETKNKELCIVLLVGAISVIINATIFSNPYGRYSGFFINPNRAGLICLLGFAVSYSIPKRNFKLLAQFIFTIAGIMTLSRYFILILVIINLASIFADKKNLIGLGIGALAFILILTASSLQLNSDRFSALKSIFSDDVDTATITKESRNETWALYEDIILDNPLIGIGYRELHGEAKSIEIETGVHNTYLMALGESGILSFLLLIIIYSALLIRSFKLFFKKPEYFYLAIVLSSFLLVSHNYFDNYMILFPTLWLYLRVHNQSEFDEDITKSVNLE
jgi:hypothetical protein